MNENIIRVYALDGRHHASDAPVIIEAGVLSKHKVSGKAFIQLKLSSISNKPIKLLSVSLTLKDSLERDIGETVSYTYDGLSVARGDLFGANVPIVIKSAEARCFSVKVTEVGFFDNSTWQGNGEAVRIEPQTSIKSALPSVYAVRAYKAKFGKNADFIAQGAENLWFCACGNANTSQESSCNACGADFDELQNIDAEALESEGLYISAKYLLSTEEKKNVKKAKDLLSQIPDDYKDSQTLKSGCEARLTEIAMNEKRVIKISVIASSIFVVSLALLLLFTKLIIPSIKYDECEKYIEDEKFVKASEAFAWLSDDDAADFEKELKDAIVAYLAEGKFYEACEIASNMERRGDYYGYGDLIVALTELRDNDRAFEDDELVLIPGYAFAGVSDIKTIKIPDTVKTIESDAFSRCANLTNIAIPKSVTQISGYAFVYSGKLTILCEAKSKPVGWNLEWNCKNHYYGSYADEYYSVLWGYTGKEYTYSFDTDGAATVASIKSSMSITLPTPVKSGWHFAGWYDNEAFTGMPVESPYYSSTKHTLYAKWVTSDGTSFDSAYDIASGQSLSAVIDTSGENVYFKFTATTSRTYTFRSSGSYDTYGYLYDSNNYQIAFNDDGAGSGNFSMSRYLNAGETVYIKVRMYSASDRGTFTVSVN